MPDLSVPGTKVTPFPKGFVARVNTAVRYAITGVAPETWFGPMQPLKPVAPEGTGGRAFDYPVGYNLQYQPRYAETISFADLRAIADGCDMLRLVIETRKDQIEAQDWDVRPRKRADGTHHQGERIHNGNRGGEVILRLAGQRARSRELGARGGGGDVRHRRRVDLCASGPRGPHLRL